MLKNTINKTIIIAEAGVNHNGNKNLAKKLIFEAARSGADYVKFQTYTADEIVTKNVKKAIYQREKLKTENQLEMLKKLMLSQPTHYDLIKYAKKCNIKFLSTGFDLPSLKFLKTLHLDFIKIPSGEINNYEILSYIGKLNKKIILSTGMSKISEIKEAIELLISKGTKKDNISLLHCTSAYPAPLEELNLNVIPSLEKKFKLNIGYSDHSTDIFPSLAAVALGAKIIEKHLTLDTEMSGPDHKASITPAMFAEMVRGIRQIEKTLGDGIKRPTSAEILNIPYARKTIVAIKEIKKGETFTINNIGIKRAGLGKSPMKFPRILGKKSKKNYKFDEII